MPTLSADGNTSEFVYSSNVTHVAANKAHVHLSGTFGGGTAKIQFKDNDGTWRDLAGEAYTVATDRILEMMPGSVIRVNLAGATTPSLVYNFR